MRTPAVPAIAAPAICDAVRGGEIGGDVAALSVTKLDGEKTAVADRVALASELCGAKVDVALVSKLGTETETSVDNVESQAAVRFNTERAVVELFQWGTAEVYGASRLVLSELVMSLVGITVLLKNDVGLAILNVVVVFRAWCPGSPFEDRWWRIEEAVSIEGLIVVVTGKWVRLARCDSAPADGLSTADASALLTADIDGIEVLSDAFDVEPVSIWDAPGDVTAVYSDLCLLIGDGLEDTVILLGTMKVPVLGVVENEVTNDTRLAAVEIMDGDVVESSRVERANDRMRGAKEAINDTLLVTTGNGAWKDVRVATKHVWYRVFSKPQSVDILWLEDAAGGSVSLALTLFMTAEVDTEDNASTGEVTIIDGAAMASRETSTWVVSWRSSEKVKSCRLVVGGGGGGSSSGGGMAKLANLLRTATVEINVHFVTDGAKFVVSFFWDCCCRTDEGDARASTTWFCAIRLLTRHKCQRSVWVKFMCGHTFVVGNGTACD
jgi:hypothetical protein